MEGERIKGEKKELGGGERGGDGGGKEMEEGKRGGQ